MYGQVRDGLPRLQRAQVRIHQAYLMTLKMLLFILRCEKIPKRKCRTAYKNDCKTKEKCQTVYEEKCTSVPKEECKNVKVRLRHTFSIEYFIKHNFIYSVAKPNTEKNAAEI